MESNVHCSLRSPLGMSVLRSPVSVGRRRAAASSGIFTGAQGEPLRVTCPSSLPPPFSGDVFSPFLFPRYGRVRLKPSRKKGRVTGIFRGQESKHEKKKGKRVAREVPLVSAIDPAEPDDGIGPKLLAAAAACTDSGVRVAEKPVDTLAVMRTLEGALAARDYSSAGRVVGGGGPKIKLCTL